MGLRDGNEFFHPKFRVSRSLLDPKNFYSVCGYNFGANGYTERDALTLRNDKAMRAFVKHKLKNEEDETWTWILTQGALDPELLRENPRDTFYLSKVAKYTLNDYTHPDDREPEYVDELCLLVSEILGEN